MPSSRRYRERTVPFPPERRTIKRLASESLPSETPYEEVIITGCPCALRTSIKEESVADCIVKEQFPAGRTTVPHWVSKGSVKRPTSSSVRPACCRPVLWAFAGRARKQRGIHRGLRPDDSCTCSEPGFDPRDE